MNFPYVHSIFAGPYHLGFVKVFVYTSIGLNRRRSMKYHREYLSKTHSVLLASALRIYSNSSIVTRLLILFVRTWIDFLTFLSLGLYGEKNKTSYSDENKIALFCSYQMLLLSATTVDIYLHPKNTKTSTSLSMCWPSHFTHWSVRLSFFCCLFFSFLNF
jgi:hypothetical protein